MSDKTLALLLWAIGQVESGGDARAVGAAGERGQFQMTPAVVASSGGYGERAAARWLRLLERELLHAGIEPLPFNLALAWNAGLGAVQRGRAPVASYRYAGRVENLLRTAQANHPGDGRDGPKGNTPTSVGVPARPSSGSGFFQP